jgi:hypothetical protein
MYPRRTSVTLRGFFSGLAEHAFQVRLGVADPPLIDYISELLTRFVATDTVYKVRTPEGRRLGEVVSMVVEAEARVGDARREIHRHIGDFALFWAGLYPEALRRRQMGTIDEFVDYCNQGKRAYHIASTLPVDAAHEDQQAVLERLSRQFELCVYGLGEIRREWEQRDDTPGGPVLLE